MNSDWADHTHNTKPEHTYLKLDDVQSQKNHVGESYSIVRAL